MRSLRGRLLVVSLLWTAAALIAAGFLIATLLRDFVERNFDDRLRASMLAIMASVEFDEDTGALTQTRAIGQTAFDQAYSGWYWQVEGEGVRLNSRSLWTDRLTAAPTPDTAASKAATVAGGPRSERLRLLAQAFSAPGEGPPLTVTVAGPQAEVEREFVAIVRPLTVSLALLGLGLGAATLVQIRVGLLPLRRLQGDLERIRAGKAERLPDQPVGELAPLAEEINTLIAHNAAVIARARTHVGNLAHALQTPLAGMANIVARPGSDPDGTLTRDAVARMQAQVKHHLKRARAAASAGVIGVRTPVAPVVEDLIGALTHIYRERQIVFRVTVAGDPVFAGERQDLDEMLGNLMDNACKWTRETVELFVLTQANELHVAVADDGHGLETDDIATALARGKRLDEQIAGSGLGLAIVRDLAELYGGRLEVNRSSHGGLAASLVLPAG